MKTLENKYPYRNLVPLDELIEARTKKVAELIANENLVAQHNPPEVLERHRARIDEYSSVVTYLEELNRLNKGEVESK